ncbi:S-layer homology domain-containing protein [Saccharibacillus sacchari]|uniref:S-layer homology domain-containing protein n=1 Tax=Saccharibacillus sacchari TaxID=456493 RepID=UPI0004B48CF1|nr:S-layer homology domain-containing protein [Saccharibacillus sacchari]
MKAFGKKLLGVIGGVTLSITLVAGSVSAANQFDDVKKSNWAYSTVQWAIANNVVKGYPDGTFRPEKQVSESEFLMMFISAYQKVTPTKGQKHWADPVYVIAKNLNWPVNGVSNDAVGRATREQAITRGEVANIIAGANGVNFIDDAAVQYLLTNNLAAGKTGNTVAGYKADDYLTRAEAVAFIQRVKTRGLETLKERPRFPSTPATPTPTPQVPSGLKGVQASMEKIVASSSTFKGYTVRASGTNVAAYDTSGRTSVSYSPAASKSQSNIVSSFRAGDTASLKLTVDVLQAVGVAVPDSFYSKLQSAVESGKEFTANYSGYTITVRPHPTAYNTLTIWFK